LASWQDRRKVHPKTFIDKGVTVSPKNGGRLFMFMSLIEKRRSIRRFTGREVESEKIDVLVEAALRSPSSRGVNPWRFIVVTNQSLLEKLSSAKHHGSAFLRNAPGDGPNQLDSLRGRISSEPPALENEASGSLLEWMRQAKVNLIRG
jgi:nitroreductase